MDRLSDIGTIKTLLSRHGFSFSKSLGQNFLINPTVCPRMAALCGADKESGVLEIGPGLGVLTTQLCKQAKKVVAIELDRRLLPVLEETLEEFDNVTVIHGDVLKLDLAALLQEEFPDMQVAVCANLPYYITSPILMALLESRLPVSSITVMVQKEAAERICAAPGTRASGAISLAVQYYASPKVLFEVSRGSFLPAPHVDSAVISLSVREAPPVQVQNEHRLFAVIKAAFGQRRKTILNAVSAGLSMPKDALLAAIESAGLSPTARAEQLTLEQFAALANALPN